MIVFPTPRRLRIGRLVGPDNLQSRRRRPHPWPDPPRNVRRHRRFRLRKHVSNPSRLSATGPLTWSVNFGRPVIAISPVSYGAPLLRLAL